MPLACLNLSAANLAAAEKLRRFGFAVNCGEFGSEKYTKASLGIYDVLANNEKPNILIISNSGGSYSWYRMLVMGIGADFKIITDAPEPLVYIDEQSSGLYIVSSDTLFKDNILKKKLSRGFLWDLVIIDEETKLGVPDYKKYKDNFPWKTRRLMINTPFPAKSPDDVAAVSELIKTVLDNADAAENADRIEFGESASMLNDELPVMRYFDETVYTGAVTRDVTFVEYTFDESVMSNLRRRVDLRSGLPVYKYGGNVFEGFDCERFEKEKKIYLKPFFGRSDVEDLRAFDKKLDSLVKLCDETLADSESRIMIYCCEKSTLEYVNKVLSCLYGTEVRVAREELIRSDEIVRNLSANVAPLARIVIGTDSLGTAGDGMESVTCVVNYELPLSPVLLERRMTRHGSANEGRRKFVIFRDTNKAFDSCVLDKVLFLQMDKAFCGELPTRNILLDIPKKADCVNELIADLKYTRDFAKQVDNCLDLIKKVKCEYTVPESETITTGKQLADFASLMLERLYKLLGLTEDSPANDIAVAMNSLSGLCVINGGRLKKVPNSGQMASSFSDEGYTNLPFAMEAVKGLADAKAQIDEFHKGDYFHLKIKQQMSDLGDSIQYSVLYGIWKYRAKEQDSGRSFKEYIKIYNDGI